MSDDPKPCPCGSAATVQRGSDEPGEWWCGCLSCDTGVSAWPKGSNQDARAMAVSTWNELVARMGAYP